MKSSSYLNPYLILPETYNKTLNRGCVEVGGVGCDPHAFHNMSIGNLVF